jgi:hypothetical protein
MGLQQDKEYRKFFGGGCFTWNGAAVGSGNTAVADAVVQTLLQHGADVAATNKVGAAGVPLALVWRCARECLHAMCVRAIVCMEMCVPNRSRLCGCAGAVGAVALLYV